jgi:hypothetical protein
MPTDSQGLTALRLNKAQWAEAPLLAPASFLLRSALPLGIAITTFALASRLASGLMGAGRNFLHVLSSRHVGNTLANDLGGCNRIRFAMAVHLDGGDWVFARPHRRSAIVLSLLAGLAAAACWCEATSS